MIVYSFVSGYIGFLILIYGLIKTHSIYKVLFLMKNESKIREDIERINDGISKTTDLKEKNKLLKELKKNYKLFHITDIEVGGPPIEHTVDENLLGQLSFAIGILIIGFILLLIGFILATTAFMLRPA